jgi:hypothetical protein
VYTIWKDAGIRYWDLAPKLCRDDGEQEMVPFLGAGVSVSDRNEAEPKLNPPYPDAATVALIAGQLGLNGSALLYFQYAIRVALRMQAYEQANGPPAALNQFVNKLIGNAYPPFAWELAELFSTVSAYSSLQEKALRSLASKDLLSKEDCEKSKDLLLPMLKLMALTTDLGSATDPLTSISNYYEYTSERKDVWRRLHEIFAGKKVPTKIHHMIAAAAAVSWRSTTPKTI